MGERDTFKVIVAGSRTFNDYPFLKEKLDKLFKNVKKPIEIVDGRAKGADALGRRYSQEVLGYDSTGFPAPWGDIKGKLAHQIGTNSKGSYFKGAGHFRNGQMRDYADAAVIFIKDNSRGSKDMEKKAKEKGLQIRVYNV